MVTSPITTALSSTYAESAIFGVLPCKVLIVILNFSVMQLLKMINHRSTTVMGYHEMKLAE